jgi:phage terminase large subunit-like protein
VLLGVAASGSTHTWFNFFADKLGPEDSVASYLVKRCGSRAALREFLGALSDAEIYALVHDPHFWARRQQIVPDGIWTTCLMLAGRGFGKTFAGAVFANDEAKRGLGRGALIGPTYTDVNETMIAGESGILAVAPPWFTPVHEKTHAKLTWPNGIKAKGYSADKPDRLRGPNCAWGWGDEPASWKYEMAALDQVPLIVRIGTEENPPRTLLTGTPKPFKKLKALAEKPGTVLVRGSSLANKFLAPSALREMAAMIGTRWGKQEVLGEMLFDVPGAIFGSAKWGRIEADPHEYAKTLERRIVAVDPAPTSESGSDETGIIVEGVRTVANLRRISVLKDASLRASSREWAAQAIREYLAFQCDALVVETNTGGELVETVITTVAQEMGVTVNVRSVRAREAKSKRAEPVSALAETGRIEFVGHFDKLEKQIETFTGQAGRRDDRTDAMCWGVHELAFGEQFFFI